MKRPFLAPHKRRERIGQLNLLSHSLISFGPDQKLACPLPFYLLIYLLNKKVKKKAFVLIGGSARPKGGFPLLGPNAASSC
uniref:Uncharacterized protein n=1 Tax=Meloidogyne incognita TaxID=6306 RepID=A0A914KNT4_MELIC